MSEGLMPRNKVTQSERCLCAFCASCALNANERPADPRMSAGHLSPAFSDTSTGLVLLFSIVLQGWGDKSCA